MAIGFESRPKPNYPVLPINNFMPTLEDEFLKKYNISSNYAFLMSDTRLISSFVKETQHILLSNGNFSQFCKIKLYQHYFPEMTPRPKYTGFENVKSHDLLIRYKLQENKNLENGNFFANTESNIAYTDSVRLAVEATRSPLLYFSGGIDSEFMLRWFMRYSREFTVVIITWLFGGEAINMHDISYATAFCKSAGVEYVEETINLENIWNSQFIYTVSQSIKRHSPQHCAYVMAIMELGKKYSINTHVMAGEVRYAMISQ